MYHVDHIDKKVCINAIDAFVEREREATEGREKLQDPLYFIRRNHAFFPLNQPNQYMCDMFYLWIYFMVLALLRTCCEPLPAKL